MRRLVFLGLVACTSASPSSQDAATDSSSTTDGDAVVTTDTGVDAGPNADDLSSTLDPIRQANGLPALGAAVWKGKDLVAIGVTGVRKLGDATNPATIADKWHLGSDTKAMTATLIGLHVDANEIHFTDTIGTLFAGETIDPGYANVTIEQLLQHRGGAPATIPNDIWSQMWADGKAPDARIKAVRAILARPPGQAVGTYAYANAGYIIAGAALERVKKATWESMMTAEIFGKLAMTSCGFGAPGTPNQVDQPWGHASTNNNVLTPVSPGPGADNPPSLGPAGTAHCSLEDWGKFLAVHLAGARNEPNALGVSQATMTKLQTPPMGGNYADGWGVVMQSWAGGTALNHSGSNTMWYVTAWIAPAKNTTMAVVTNRGDNTAAMAVDSAFAPLIATYIK